MRRSEERVGTARPALLRASWTAAGVALAIAAGPALAGDRALLHPIGFSPDGRYFAFEEFGVQDGSGFAYSNIYIIDLPADAWVSGTPIRMKGDDAEWDRPLAEIRAEAHEQADPQLSALEIVQPAEILVLLGDGVRDDGKTMGFSYPGWGPPGTTEGDEFALQLSTFPIDSSEDCETFLGQQALGFRLVYEAEGQSRTVHEDEGSIPASRGCTTDYRLYAVLSPFHSTGPDVAIISSYPFGFEGPDRRFIAVPLSD